MAFVRKFQKNVLTFVNVFLYVSGISIASHLKENLVSFIPSKIPSVDSASMIFCVARPEADPAVIQRGIDWVCGSGLVNCEFIQPSWYCYVPNNIVATASYVYNSYYQAAQKKEQGTCYFSNTAKLTNKDPSHGACLFPGSPASVVSSSFAGDFGTPPTASFMAPGPL